MIKEDYEKYFENSQERWTSVCMTVGTTMKEIASDKPYVALNFRKTSASELYEFTLYLETRLQWEMESKLPASFSFCIKGIHLLWKAIIEREERVRYTRTNRIERGNFICLLFEALLKSEALTTCADSWVTPTARTLIPLWLWKLIHQSPVVIFLAIRKAFSVAVSDTGSFAWYEHETQFALARHEKEQKK